jgi:hypothetical protein
MAAVKDSITGLYITYFNRAPDANGLAFWEAQAAANGASAALNGISSAFALNSVAITNYPASMTTSAFVTQMYGYALNRGTAPTNVGPIDPTGQAYWEGRVAAVGRDKTMVEFTVATLDYNPAADTTSTAAQKQAAIDAQSMFKNKVLAGQHFAESALSNVPLDANGNPDTTSAQYVASQDVVSAITQTQASYVAGYNKATTYTTTGGVGALPASAYSVFANQASANEGAAATFKVNTTNVADGTVLTVTLGGTSNSADYTVATTTVTNNTATITVNLAADTTTEGAETVTIATVNGVAPSVIPSTTINDTSLTPAGSSFVLTTGNDNAVGTAGNDTINGLVDTSGATPNPTTLSAGDIINGGAGTTDALNITTAGATPDALNNADITNIEIFNVRATSTGATTFNAALVAGETEVNADRGTGALNISNMSQGVAYGLKGNGNAVLGAQNVGWDAATTSATLNISGGVGPTGTTAPTLAVTGSNLASTTINSTGAANTIGTLGLPATVTSATINATTGLTTGAVTATGLQTLTVTGAGAVNLNSGAALSSTVTNINASANTGGVTVGSGATTTAFTGGTGNDFLNIGSLIYSNTAKIAGGAGTDTLAISGSTATMFPAAALANISGFETLQVSGGGTVDFSTLPGITALNLDTATSETVNNIGAATPVTVVGDQSTSVALNVANATVVTNTADALTLTLDKTGAATATSIVTVANISSPGLETLNIVSSGVLGNVAAVTTDDNVINSLSNLAGSNVNLINVSGASDLTLQTGAIAKDININAGTATGNLFINANGNTGKTGITGGSGADTLWGGTAADVINGGSGNDTIYGAGGGNTINGGLGNDTYKFYTANSTVTSLTSFDKVTVTSGDIFDNIESTIPSNLTVGTYAPGTQSLTAINSAANLLTALTQKVNAGVTALAYTAGSAATAGVDGILGNADDVAAVASSNGAYLVTITDTSANAMGGTYLVIENGTTTSTVDAADTVIQLVGITGTPGLTAIGGDLTLSFA